MLNMNALGNYNPFSGGYGLFSPGSIYTIKYFYASDAVQAQNPGLAGGINQYTVGVGNYTKALFTNPGTVGSTQVTNLRTWVFATNTSTIDDGLLSSPNILFTGTAGNATYGMFFGGFINNAVTNTTKRVTYSGNLVVPGATLGIARAGMAAVGNATFAYASGGYTGSAATNFTDKYTFASNTTVFGQILLQARACLAGCGNQTVAAFAGGGTDLNGSNPIGFMNNIFFANDANFQGTALITPMSFHVATGNATKGVFTWGKDTSQITNKYNYSANTMAVGTNLPSLIDTYYGVGAASSTPGGF